jgi:hypothetical protein
MSLDPKYYVPFEITEDKLELGRSVRCVKDWRYLTIGIINYHNEQKK